MCIGEASLRVCHRRQRRAYFHPRSDIVAVVCGGGRRVVGGATRDRNRREGRREWGWKLPSFHSRDYARDARPDDDETSSAGFASLDRSFFYFISPQFLSSRLSENYQICIIFIIKTLTRCLFDINIFDNCCFCYTSLQFFPTRTLENYGIRTFYHLKVD